MGTLTILPSERETPNASSVIFTSTANGLLANVEVLIPNFQKSMFVLFRHSFYSPQFCTGKSSIPSQTNGRKPKLSLRVITLNMGMRRFVPVARIEK